MAFGTALRAQTPGALDSSYNPNVTGGAGTVFTTAVQPDGKLIVTGNFGAVGGSTRVNLARLNADGTVDPSFTASTNGDVYSVAVQVDGKLVLAGAFTSVNGTAVNRIARLNGNGTLDTGFTAGGAGANGNVYSVAVQADGKLVVGGLFTSVNGMTGINRIARLHANGALDSGFNIGGAGASNAVLSIALQADGKLVLGGTFFSVNGTTVGHFTRLNADGTLDAGFNVGGAGANGDLTSVVVQADGKLVIGGLFTNVNGTAVNRIARLNANGTLDSGFNIGGSGANDFVLSAAVQADGKLVLGGAFTSVNGVGVKRIARLNTDGTLDTGFNPLGSGANSDVNSAAVQADGRVLIGGAFSNMNGSTRNLLARLNNGEATQNIATPDPTQVQWQRGGASPEVSQVTFELSTDGGNIWNVLGNGTRVGSSANWQLTGLSLPYSGQLRARGRTTAGYFNGGSGLVETVTAFTVANSAPTVTTVAASALSSTGATLNAMVGTNGAATDVTFQYSTDASMTSGVTTTTVQTLAGGAGSTSVSQPITGLTLRTTYFFRVRAVNSIGTTEGAILAFSANTPPSAPDGVASATTGDQKTITLPLLSPDPDGDTVTVTSVTHGAHITVNSSSGANVTFTPDANFVGNSTLSYTVSDGFGGGGTGTIVVTIVDNDAPTVMAHANVGPIEATNAAGATVTYAAATATDAVTASPTITYSRNSGTIFPIGTTTVTVTAKDAANNTGTGTFTVTVQDTTAPVVMHPNVIAEATSVDGATVTYAAATATDAVTANPTITYSQNSGTFFPFGTTTVTVTATDAANNMGTGAFTVTVQDTTAPVVMAHEDVIAEATSAAGATVTYASATVTDAVTASPTISYSQNSGTVFPLGSTTVTVTAKDAANNTGTGTFTVTVRDTTAPLVAAHPNVGPIEATSAAGATVTYAAATATDAVTANPIITYSKNSGTVFPIGTTTVTVTAKDAANNMGAGTFTVTVQDTTAPVVMAHANVIAEATSAAGATVTYAAAIATDVGTASPAITYSQNSGTVFPLGTTTVTITAMDAANNTGTGTFTVTVQDTTAPVVTHPNVIAEATSADGATVTYAAATATDAVTANPIITYSQNSGTFFPFGVTTVTVTATDAANNTSTRTFKVTVQDTTVPIIRAPASGFTPLILAVSRGGTTSLPDYTTQAVTSDNVAVTSVTQWPPAGLLIGEDTPTMLVTLTAQDAGGNSAEVSFTVTVTVALAVKAGGVPGAGVDPRVPAGTIWGTFSVPSITMEGMKAGWLATALTTARASFQGIFAGPLLAPTLRARTGYAATDSGGTAVPGVTFKSFREPVFAGDDFAVLATVQGAQVGAGNDSGLWVGESGSLKQIAREGAVAPGAEAAKFKGFTSLAMPSPGVVFFTATLVAPAAKDMGLWVWTAATGAKLALLEGSFVNTDVGPVALKTFQALTSVTGSFGQGRYDANGPTLDVRLSFADPDHTVAIGKVSADGSLLVVQRSGQTDPNGRVPVSFGVPSSPGQGLPATAVTTFMPDAARGITPMSAVTVYDYAEGGIVAQQGMTAPGAEPATFKSFLDPVTGFGFDGGRVQCFAAKLAGAATSSDSGLWTYTSSLALVAREGAEPPGAGGTKWKSFTSLAVMDGRGPMFTAKLTSGTARVTAMNDMGLWATDSTGALRLIFREGDMVSGGQLKSFNVLGAVAGSPGQRRAWTLGDGSARVIYLAFFTDGSSAILSTAVP